MRSCSQSWIVMLAACLVAACLGCQKGADNSGGPDGQTGEGTAAKQTSNKGSSQGSSANANQAPHSPAPTIPEVKLAEKDRDKCLVRVGDQMPEGELPDLGGRLHRLDALYGEKVTVVCFWTSGKPPYGPMRAVALLEDLSKDYAEPYAEKGLQVIGIKQGDREGVARQLAQEAGVRFPTLQDPGGAYLAKVATEGLPRIYVLDADGKILWFDMEYSEITRDKLRQTIRVKLGEI